jgi:peptide-methionine (S)-S-oxide reductase
MDFKVFMAAAATFITAGMTSAHAASETAIFAGGCFWCVESDMDHVKGVTSTISGYGGGTTANPTYEDHEGYVESVKVEFDPAIISYAALTAHFLRTIDAVDGGGQFCDRGHSYIPALIPLTPEQKQVGEAALADAEKALGQKLAVAVIDTPSFYDAEDYHQNYYLGENRILSWAGVVKQKDAYHYYREGCGRDARIKALWGDAAFSFPAGGGES